MNRTLVVIIIIAVVAVGAIFAVPFLLGAGPFNGNMNIQYLDENGKPIGTPFAFIGGGQPVTGFTATVTYTVTTSGGDTQSLSVTGTLEVVVYLNTPSAGQAGSTSNALSNSEKTGSFSFDYTLASLINVDTPGKTYGWRIVVTASLTATANVDGETRTSSWSDSTSFSLSWEDGDFTLTGTVGV